MVSVVAADDPDSGRRAGLAFGRNRIGHKNTPVTNTTTGSVPSARAGMASAIDMSARMISLAINIALVGFVLVEGVLSYLKGALPGSLSASQFRSLAEKIAAGHDKFLPLAGLSSADSVKEVIHAALAHGFGLVMLYGGICVWVLAALSILTFSPRRAARDLAGSEP